MVDSGDWKGAVSERTNVADVELVDFIGPSVKGTAGAFLGLASDGQRYWIKVLNNRHGARSAMADQIVGRVGALIGAPVCSVATIEIPTSFAGTRVGDRVSLEAGIAHASREIPGRVEDVEKVLSNRGDDANAERHAGYFGLYDWCYGADIQGLIAHDQQNRFYSHDHGWFLPGGANWESELLFEVLREAREYPDSGEGLSTSALEQIADLLETLKRESLAEALRMIPLDWPLENDELEDVGYFLEYRAQPVAGRLRALAEKLRSPATG